MLVGPNLLLQLKLTIVLLDCKCSVAADHKLSQESKITVGQPCKATTTSYIWFSQRRLVTGRTNRPFGVSGFGNWINYVVDRNLLGGSHVCARACRWRLFGFLCNVLLSVEIPAMITRLDYRLSVEVALFQIPSCNNTPARLKPCSDVKFYHTLDMCS